MKKNNSDTVAFHDALQISPEVVEFLRESNAIEDEYSDEALHDAIRAWMYGMGAAIKVGSILKIHERLMKRLRPDIAGKLRNCDVYIGGHRKIFISKALIRDELKQWAEKVHANLTAQDEKTLELHAKNCHVTFEQMHPFEDGNGRVGRILYNLQRIRAGLPLHIIKADERQDYYLWFNS